MTSQPQNPISNGPASGEAGAKAPVWPWGFLPAVLIGGAVRLLPAFTHGWALNDGGLFVAMARVIATTGGLPATVKYNGSLPFCYPPLGFIFAALLSKLGVPLALYFRFAPALWSTAMVWAGWRLARTIWKDDRAAAAAALTLALLPWSYVWYVMGGGVARAPAYFFAVVAIERASRVFRDRDARALPLAIIFAGLTMATHLECGHYLVVTLVVLAICYARSGHDAGRLFAVLAGALLLSSPWWGLCLSRYGFGPFINAWHSGGSGWQHRSWALSGEPYPLLGLVALGGFALAVKRKDWFVPLWAVVIALAEPRSTRALLAVPIALGVGYGIAFLWPAKKGNGNAARTVGATVLIAWGLLLSLLFDAHMRSLTPRDLAAMSYLRNHAAPGTRVLVAAAGNDWAGDRSGEWLPALTSCASISTVQGAEWLPNNAFARRWRAHLALEKTTDLVEMEAWAAAQGQKYDLLYLPLDGAADGVSRASVQSIAKQAAASTRYRLWYSNPGVMIFARNAGVWFLLK